jgi:hypothetical protein
MDNQHRKIVGYRELNEEEIAQMNDIKEVGATIGSLVAHLEELSDAKHVDARWVSIGKTHLQQGLMALVRAIAQPTTF